MGTHSPYLFMMINVDFFRHLKQGLMCLVHLGVMCSGKDGY